MLITCKPNEIIEGQPQLWLGNLKITRYNTIFYNGSTKVNC